MLLQDSRGRGLTAAVIVLLLLVSLPIFSQTINGTLTGIVYDQTGAVVPNVKVTVRNIDTGVGREMQTNETGRYHAPALPVGRYAIEFVADGFEKIVRQPIQVEPAVERAVDVTLQPGATQEVVSIIAEAPLIQTTQAQLSRGVETKRIMELPLANSTITALALLSPGAAPNQNGRPGSGFSINGGRTRSNYFTLDGANNIDQSLAIPRQSVPQEVLAEFRIITNNFSAEFGRNSGSVVQQITKSGTNEFHGVARWTWLGNGLDSLTTNQQRIFNNAKSRGLSDYAAVRSARGVQVTNEGLVNAGGPIKKNRVFFFTNHDRQWFRTTAVPTTTGLSPQAISLIDANQSVFAPGTVAFLKKNWPTANDPTSQGNITIQAPAGTTFAGGVDRLTLPLQTINRGLGGALSYATNYWRFLQRVDGRLTNSDNISVRYILDDSNDPGAPTAIPGQEVGQVYRNQSLTLNETHVFTPTILNEARLTYARRAFKFPEKFGPQYQIVGLPTLGNQNYPQFRTDNLYEITDNLSIVRGRHNLRTGGNVLRYDLNSFFAPNLRGNLYYPSLQDFLFDRSAQWAQYAGTGSIPARTYEYSMFFQDDFRASQALTLNLGIRYEYTTAPFGYFSNAKADPNNWAPRFGFAYAPTWGGWLTGNGRTSIRGGYSVAYDQVFQNILLNNSRNYPRGVSVAIGPENNTRWFDRQPPAPTPEDYVKQGGNPLLLPLRLFSPDKNIRQPFSQQYSLGIERQLFSNYAFRMFYVGSRASGLVREVERNLGFNATVVNNNASFYQPLLQQYGMQPVRNAAGTVTGYRVNPTRGSVLIGDALAMSTYHSLQTSLVKRYSQGLVFELNYTYSSFINDSDDVLGGQTNNTLPAVPFNFKLDRGRSGFDVPHRFVGNFAYELPFLRDRGAILGRAFGGWAVNGIITMQSGIPYTLLNANNALGILPGQISTVELSQRPSLNPSGSGPTSPTIPNPRCIANPTNSGIIGNIGRNTERTGGTQNMDAALVKNVRLWREENRIQFRWEVFNVLNHRNFLVIPDRTVGASTNVDRFQNRGFTNVAGRTMQFMLRVYF